MTYTEMHPHEVFNRMRVESYSEQTIRSYRSYIDGFLFFGDEPVFRQENINPYLNHLAFKGLSPSSINIARSALIYFFDKVLKQPITIEILHANRKNKEPDPISREDIKAMIEAETNLEKRTLIELGCGCGLRSMELRNLKWKDIDFRQRRIRVVQGKGRKDRIVPLPEAAIAHLNDLKAGKINSYVFPNRDHPEKDWHISKGTPLNWVKDAARKAGIERNVITHGLRTSFITHLIENGYPEKYAQKLAGHNSRETTHRYEAVADYRLMQVRSPLDDLDKGIEMEKQLRERAILNTKKVFSN